MAAPSKKDIKLAVEKLKAKSEGAPTPQQQSVGKPSAAKSSQRIRKQGV